MIVGVCWLATTTACAGDNAARPHESNAPPAPAQPQNEADAYAALRGSPHVLLGIPTDADPKDDYLMDKGAYVVSYSRGRNLANWVAWRLTADDLGPEERANNFRADDDLPPDFYRVRPTDYEGSGFDRGHLCPSSHRTKDASANSLTFLMSNMQPQIHSLNAGPWKSLETHERELASKLGKHVYIVAGGLFADNPLTIASKVPVPKANFRVTVVLEPEMAARDVTAQTPVYAIEMPNDGSVRGRKWTEFQVEVDDVELRTGYDFLTELPDAVEASVEARAP